MNADVSQNIDHSELLLSQVKLMLNRISKSTDGSKDAIKNALSGVFSEQDFANDPARHIADAIEKTYANVTTDKFLKFMEAALYQLPANDLKHQALFKHYDNIVSERYKGLFIGCDLDGLKNLREENERAFDVVSGHFLSSAFVAACRYGRLDVLSFLKENCDPETWHKMSAGYKMDGSLKSGVEMACKYGQVKVLEFLKESWDEKIAKTISSNPSSAAPFYTMFTGDNRRHIVSACEGSNIDVLDFIKGVIGKEVWESTPCDKHMREMFRVACRFQESSAVLQFLKQNHTESQWMQMVEGGADGSDIVMTCNHKDVDALKFLKENVSDSQWQDILRKSGAQALQSALSSDTTAVVEFLKNNCTEQQWNDMISTLDADAKYVFCNIDVARFMQQECTPEQWISVLSRISFPADLDGRAIELGSRRADLLDFLASELQSKSSEIRDLKVDFSGYKNYHEAIVRSLTGNYDIEDDDTPKYGTDDRGIPSEKAIKFCSDGYKLARLKSSFGNGVKIRDMLDELDGADKTDPSSALVQNSNLGDIIDCVREISQHIACYALKGNNTDSHLETLDRERIRSKANEVAAIILEGNTLEQLDGVAKSWQQNRNRVIADIRDFPEFSLPPLMADNSTIIQPTMQGFDNYRLVDITEINLLPDYPAVRKGSFESGNCRAFALQKKQSNTGEWTNYGSIVFSVSEDSLSYDISHWHNSTGTLPTYEEKKVIDWFAQEVNNGNIKADFKRIKEVKEPCPYENAVGMKISDLNQEKIVDKAMALAEIFDEKTKNAVTGYVASSNVDTHTGKLNRNVVSGQTLASAPVPGRAGRT